MKIMGLINYKLPDWFFYLFNLIILVVGIIVICLVS